MIPSTRPVQDSDLPQLAEMIASLATFHDDLPGVAPRQLARDVLGPCPWFTVIVAEGARGMLQGYAALMSVGQLQFGARALDMHHLFVVPKARGTGVGTRLVDAAIACARNKRCAYVSVGTHPDNRAAGVFYESRGFNRRDGFGHRFSMTLTSSQPPT